MKIEIPFGNEIKVIQIEFPPERVIVARSKNPTTSRNWTEVVSEAIHAPIGVKALNEQKLLNKRVVIITDDWARPTPAHQVIPLIINELRPTGVEDSNITFITASGMHDPMSRDDLKRKLGQEIVEKYRCISHDGGDWNNLVFFGISPQGTPIWINKYVAEADYKIAFGRIYLHEAYGYEGGYKMILPGVSGFDTIARDHSFNFSDDSIEGIHDNPSRREADAIGRMVGIDFLINVVVNDKGQPIKAFCGETEMVHQLGIEYGDREVWAAEIHEKADIVIASPGIGDYDLKTLYRASRAAKDNGTIICLASKEAKFEPRLEMPLSEIVRLHEKRNWNLSEREIQWHIKSIRGKFYHYRQVKEIQKRKVILTPDPDTALKKELEKSGSDIRIVVLPEAKTTLPKEKLYH